MNIILEKPLKNIIINLGSGVGEKAIKLVEVICKNLHKDFTFESAKTSCLDKIGQKIFLKNSWCIIRKKKELLNWIKNKKINDVILNK